MSNFIPQLPKQVNVDDPRSVAEALRQVVAYLNVQPRWEIKQVEASTEDSVVVRTNLDRVLGVVLLQAYKSGFITDTLPSASMNPDWREVEGGVKIRVDLDQIQHVLRYMLIGR